MGWHSIQMCAWGDIKNILGIDREREGGGMGGTRRFHLYEVDWRVGQPLVLCASAMRIILQFTAGNIMGMRTVFFHHS